MSHGIPFSDGIRLIKVQHFGNGGIGFSIRGGIIIFCKFLSSINGVAQG